MTWLRRLGLLLAGVALAGCSIGPELRRHLGELDNAWRLYRDASAPAPGVDGADHARLTSSVTAAIEEARRASEAE